MIDAFLNQTITEISRTTTDKYHDPTHTILYQNVPCAFDYKVNRQKLSVEEQAIVDAMCYMKPSYIVKKDDRIKYNREYYLVVRVNEVYDLFGNLEHYEILLRSR